MPTNYSEIYSVAVELSQGQTEAHWRSSISRAYYACLHLARSITKISPTGTDTHSQVWHSLTELGKRRYPSYNYQAAAIKGRSLKSRREEADYELSKAMPKQECLDALEQAKKLIEALNSLSP